MANSLKIRLVALFLIIASCAIAYWTYFPYKSWKLGLDLNGGTHLAYKADTDNIAGDVEETMSALREVIERRVNLFGVSEPVVMVEKSSLGGKDEHRLIVELPGVTNIDEAVKQIGETPLLEFRTLKKGADIDDATATTSIATLFDPARLTGEHLQSAMLEFNNTTREPMITLKFNEEGKRLFSEITKANVGNVVAIFLDGQVISMPVVREEIKEGTAQITGSFTVAEGRELVRNLNYGALPVKIELVRTETIGPTLGEAVLHAGVKAGLIAFVVISIFLVLWYRLPGVISVIALGMYVVFNLALFKLIPVTLTSAGIAGFVLSLGMAVDANILIFERTKEELRRGRALKDAVREGFSRAWLSIRDSNTSSIITAFILYYFASTAVIKGFALVLFIGVVVSMFTAITATRTMLFAIPHYEKKFWRMLFSAGFNK